MPQLNRRLSEYEGVNTGNDIRIRLAQSQHDIESMSLTTQKTIQKLQNEINQMRSEPLHKRVHLEREMEHMRSNVPSRNEFLKLQRQTSGLPDKRSALITQEIEKLKQVMSDRGIIGSLQKIMDKKIAELNCKLENFKAQVVLKEFNSLRQDVESMKSGCPWDKTLVQIQADIDNMKQCPPLMNLTRSVESLVRPALDKKIHELQKELDAIKVGTAPLHKTYAQLYDEMQTFRDYPPLARMQESVLSMVRPQIEQDMHRFEAQLQNLARSTTHVPDMYTRICNMEQEVNALRGYPGIHDKFEELIAPRIDAKISSLELEMNKIRSPDAAGPWHERFDYIEREIGQLKSQPNLQQASMNEFYNRMNQIQNELDAMKRHPPELESKIARIQHVLDTIQPDMMFGMSSRGGGQQQHRSRRGRSYSPHMMAATCPMMATSGRGPRAGSLSPHMPRTNIHGAQQDPAMSQIRAELCQLRDEVRSFAQRAERNDMYPVDRGSSPIQFGNAGAKGQGGCDKCSFMHTGGGSGGAGQYFIDNESYQRLQQETQELGEALKNLTERYQHVTSRQRGIQEGYMQLLMHMQDDGRGMWNNTKKGYCPCYGGMAATGSHVRGVGDRRSKMKHLEEQINDLTREVNHLQSVRDSSHWDVRLALLQQEIQKITTGGILSCTSCGVPHKYPTPNK